MLTHHKALIHLRGRSTNRRLTVVLRVPSPILAWRSKFVPFLFEGEIHVLAIAPSGEGRICLVRSRQPCVHGFRELLQETHGGTTLVNFLLL